MTITRAGASLGRLAGPTTVDILLRRWRLLNTTLDPKTIEDGWEDQAGASWRAAARAALGEAPPFHRATRRELWQVCKTLAAWIGQRQPRCDHYPDGWREAYELVVGGGKAEEPQRAAEADRADAMETLRYLASLRGREVADLLTELKVTEKTITRADRDRALGLWGVR